MSGAFRLKSLCLRSLEVGRNWLQKLNENLDNQRPMNESTPITLPKRGESILSATVVQWFKNVGDRVERDEPLLEVSTDKVNSEIPSPVDGALQAIVAGN